MDGDDPATTTEQPASDGADDPADRNALAQDARLPVGYNSTARPITLAPTVMAHTSPDPRTAARAHLRAMRHASAELARALMASGYPPHRWQAPDPTLRELARDLPQPSLAALFAQLDRFSGEDGPSRLVGDAAAIAVFTSEAHLLDDILRPLRALSLRRRAGSPPDHPARPLERILADPESGVQLDQLARAVDALVALAPALASAGAEAAPRLVSVLALPRPELAPHLPRVPVLADPPAASQSDAPTVIARDAPTIPAQHPFMPGAVVSAASDRAPVAGPTVPPDAPTVPWLPADATVPLPPGKVPRPRPRLPIAPRLPHLPSRWRGPYLLIALGIVICLACAVASIVLTFAPLSSSPARVTLAPTTAHATPTRALPTATLVPPTSTPLPAWLAVSPTFINLACPFTGTPSTLTLRDTGGASLTWQIANPPLTLLFSATSGSLDPGASVAVQVRAVWRQHGTHSFSVTSNGGSRAVSYTVCR